MGWGCYKHEWDAGSDDWRKALDALCDRKLEQKEKTFGRDSEICPKCYTDLEALLDQAEKAFEKIEKYGTQVGVLNVEVMARIIGVYIPDICNKMIAAIQKQRRG